ncbi:MAG: C40 family peptidase [Gammaproteobacteria bacterium]|nr:C40 family peptidase [Gammaproteobacteria bacterium]
MKTTTPWAMAAGCVRYLTLAALFAGVAACGAAPTQPPHNAGRADVVTIARTMVGVPYRYGGASPSGFDCSGLVHYAYSHAGHAVPRTTELQYARAKAVHGERLAAGDLLFFVIRNKPSHVGIYVGDGRFVHAPSSGKAVSYGSLADPYWQARLVKIGRF